MRNDNYDWRLMLDPHPALRRAGRLGRWSAIRQSTWIYMAANVGHILALVVFAGAVAVLDLRMAGAFAATSPGIDLRRARHVVMLAFLALVLTGAVLFTAEASHEIMNRLFQFKLALIALGLLNVALFEIFTAPKVRELPPLAPLPAAAKRAEIASIAIWLMVAACGRSIAYFCDQMPVNSMSSAAVIS